VLGGELDAPADTGQYFDEGVEPTDNRCEFVTTTTKN
jgi:hypothetical protein